MYLPEQLVLHIDEYTKQKQEDNTTEVKEAKKWNLSVEEYRAQKEILSKRNEERAKDHDNRPIFPDNQQNDNEKLSVGGKPEDSFPPIRPGESVEQRLGVDELQKQQEAYERIQREHKRRHSENYEVIEGGFKEVLIFHHPFSFRSSDRNTRSTFLSPISSCVSEYTSFGISFQSNLTPFSTSRW